MNAIALQAPIDSVMYSCKGVIPFRKYQETDLADLLSEMLPVLEGYLGMEVPKRAGLDEPFSRRRLRSQFEAMRVSVENKMIWSCRATRQAQDDISARGYTVGIECLLVGDPDSEIQLYLSVVHSNASADVSMERYTLDAVYDLLNAADARNAGIGLGRPINIETEEEVAFLIRHIESSARSMPLVVISCDNLMQAVIPPEEVAKAVAGLCYVYAISPSASWAITQTFGKEMSAFNGAIRSYLCDFTREDNPRDHRLMIPRRGVPVSEKRNNLAILTRGMVSEALKSDQKGFRFAQVVAMAKRSGEPVPEPQEEDVDVALCTATQPFDGPYEVRDVEPPAVPAGVAISPEPTQGYERDIEIQLARALEEKARAEARAHDAERRLTLVTAQLEMIMATLKG